MDEQQSALLREAVFSASTGGDSYHHGERHWRAVAHAGLQLAPSLPGSRPLVILLFALFHDAMRENEYTDPEHGLRGAELSRQLRADELLQLEDRDSELLTRLAETTTAASSPTTRRSEPAGMPTASTSGA